MIMAVHNHRQKVLLTREFMIITLSNLLYLFLEVGQEKVIMIIKLFFPIKLLTTKRKFARIPRVHGMPNETVTIP